MSILDFLGIYVIVIVANEKIAHTGSAIFYIHLYSYSPTATIPRTGRYTELLIHTLSTGCPFT